MLSFLRRSKPEDELQQAISRFLGAFQVVFEDDWRYSREMLERDMEYAVSSAGTFLEPGPKYEDKNWGARTALLRAHKELLAAMRAKGLKPQVPEQDPYFNYTWPNKSSQKAE